jgi:hypothetical protein
MNFSASVWPRGAVKKPTNVTAVKAAILPTTLCLLSLLGAGATRTTTGASARRDTSAWQTTASASWPIEVKDWVKPERGWLYVLDPQPIPHALAGRIWLLNPEEAKVMGSISTGSSPDFALSPDGARLYVASAAKDDWSDLAVIDTANGTVIQTATIEDRVVANGIPPFSSMAVSGDGLALRILLNPPTSPDTDGFLLATFNTRTGDFLPGTVHLGNCGMDDSSTIQLRTSSIFCVRRPIASVTYGWMRNPARSTTPSWCFPGSVGSALPWLSRLPAIEP